MPYLDNIWLPTPRHDQRTVRHCRSQTSGPHSECQPHRFQGRNAKHFTSPHACALSPSDELPKPKRLNEPTGICGSDVVRRHTLLHTTGCRLQSMYYDATLHLGYRLLFSYGCASSYTSYRQHIFPVIGTTQHSLAALHPHHIASMHITSTPPSQSPSRSTHSCSCPNRDILGGGGAGTGVHPLHSTAGGASTVRVWRANTVAR